MNQAAIVLPKSGVLKRVESPVRIRFYKSRNKYIMQILRKSGLESPTMVLTGHSGEIYTAQFSNSGKFVASGSFDKSICKIFQAYIRN